jgi:hypothetical protein
MFDPSADGNGAIALAAQRGHVARRSVNFAIGLRLLAKATSRSLNDCCETCASIRRHSATSPFNWLLRMATSRSSSDYCEMSASIRRPTTTTPCDWLRRTATAL